MIESNVKFVSQKINKVKWRPEYDQLSVNPNIFVSGSWDDEKCRICFWSINEKSEDVEFSVPEGEPRLLCDVQSPGGVTDIGFINSDLFVSTSQTGALTVYKHFSQSETLSVLQSYPSLHHHGDNNCPATSLDIRGEDMIVTVGEDGCINLINLERKQPTRSFDNADCCCLNGVKFLKKAEILTINSSGQLKAWDIRLPTSQPVKTLNLSGGQVPLYCLDKHPTQPHIIATGGQDKTLCIWDMRQEAFPVTLLSAHTSIVWDVKFHPNNPNNLFTCSQDGTVWHWDASNMSTKNTLSSQNVPFNLGASLAQPSTVAETEISQSNPWLVSDAAKHRLEINDLVTDNQLPVNSLDIQNRQLIFGTDGEQIYSLRNLPIK